MLLYQPPTNTGRFYIPTTALIGSRLCMTIGHVSLTTLTPPLQYYLGPRPEAPSAHIGDAVGCPHREFRTTPSLQLFMLSNMQHVLRCALAQRTRGCAKRDDLAVGCNSGPPVAARPGQETLTTRRPAIRAYMACLRHALVACIMLPHLWLQSTSPPSTYVNDCLSRSSREGGRKIGVPSGVLVHIPGSQQYDYCIIVIPQKSSRSSRRHTQKNDAFAPRSGKRGRPWGTRPSRTNIDAAIAQHTCTRSSGLPRICDWDKPGGVQLMVPGLARNVRVGSYRSSRRVGVPCERIISFNLTS